MSYVVMARKWRPQNFEDMVGQEHIVRTLKNALQANRISHAYLFTGPRGVGKTTTARLLAKAVNCLSPVNGEPCNHCVRCEEIVSGATPDVIEIDAASNGLVDDARELREKVRYAPLTCRYKVMIIDEVHMMSNAAFNALLKTLEEPPAHSIFILATTESHKVPATIVSRCQRFDFRRIPIKQITERLALMAAREGIKVDEEALHIIARGADGSLRDAQSLLDQIISFSGQEVTPQDVVAVLGLVDTQIFIGLVDAISSHEADRALQVIEQLVNQGADLRLFMKDWVEYWRTLVMHKVLGDRAREMQSQSAAVMEAVQRQSALFDLEELTALSKLAAATDDELRRSQHPRVMLELFLIQACQAQRVVSLESVWNQLTTLENRLTRMPDAPLPVAGGGQTKVQSSSERETSVQENAVQNDPEPSPRQEEPGEPALVADMLEEAGPETYVDVVKQAWSGIMEAVGQENRRTQALLRDVTVAQAEEGWVELACASDYHKTGLDKEDSKKIIEAVLEKHLGRPTRLRLTIDQQNSLSDDPAVDEQTQRQKAFDEIASKEPLVQKTLELFGGKIVDVTQHK